MSLHECLRPNRGIDEKASVCDNVRELFQGTWSQTIRVLDAERRLGHIPP